MMLGEKTLESSTKDCSSKFRSKHSTVLVLCHSDWILIEMFQNHDFKEWISLKIMLLWLCKVTSSFNLKKTLFSPGGANI